jgi:hypothetical protein
MLLSYFFKDFFVLVSDCCFPDVSLLLLICQEILDVIVNEIVIVPVRNRTTAELDKVIVFKVK